MPSAYTIYPKYDFDALCLYIAKVSGSDIKTVTTKRQLRYLNAYLTSDQMAVESVLCEHEYIDKFYMSDYAEYVVRCFTDYPRKTSRIHFFATKFTEAEFEAALNGEDGEKGFFESLKDFYLGFMVVRPIPDTFIATTCLRPYQCLLDGGDGVVVLKKRVSVNLFGVPLSVESLPYQEQDRLVSICASASLWSFLNAPIYSFGRVPPPSEITKKAIEGSGTHSRIFPSDGLSVSMVSAAIAERGLDPITLSLHDMYLDAIDESKKANPSIHPEERLFSKMHELIYAYGSCGLPLLLGLSVYGKVKGGGGDYHCLGRHVVTVTGFDLSGGACAKDVEPGYKHKADSIALRAHKIHRVYVHDDQLGPYSAMVMSEDCFTVANNLRDICGSGQKQSDGKEEKKRWLRLELKGGSADERQVWRYIPSEILLGLTKKIRIEYDRIEKTCVYLQQFLANTWDELEKAAEKQGKSNAIKEGFLFDARNIEWDIRLYTVNDYKEHLLESSEVHGDRAKYLASSWPKYLWVAAGRSGDGELLFEHVFDATDINQGNVYINSIYYSDGFYNFTKNHLRPYLEEVSLSPAVGSSLYANDANCRHFADRLIGEFQTDSEILDETFGCPKPPAYIKPVETKNDGIRRQSGVMVLRHGLRIHESSALKEDEDYIWAICERGYLYIGQDIALESNDSSSGRMGHPTLQANLWARIAGDLKYDKEQQKWIVSNASGRFCRDYSGVEESHLTNALDLFCTYFPDENFDMKYLSG